MSWFKKEEKELPPSFQGKTAEQIDAELKAASALQAENERLKQQTTQFAQTQSELEQTKARLQALEANKNPQPPQNPQEPASVFTDENAAFAERLTPLQQAIMLNNARLARMSAESALEKDPNLGPVFKKYNAEYQQMVQQLSLQQAVVEAVYSNIVAVIAKNHWSEIMTEVRKEKNEFFTEGAGSTPPAKPQDKDELSNDEIATAKRMGLTPEQYKNAKKDIQFVGLGVGA